MAQPVKMSMTEIVGRITNYLFSVAERNGLEWPVQKAEMHRDLQEQAITEIPQGCFDAAILDLRQRDIVEERQGHCWLNADVFRRMVR